MITPFSAAIAFNMASLLLSFFFGFFRASFSNFSRLGKRFCLLNASMCQASVKSLSNARCSCWCFALAIKVSSYGVYFPTTNGSMPSCTTAVSVNEDRSKAAELIPPLYSPSWVCRTLRSMLRRASLQWY